MEGIVLKRPPASLRRPRLFIHVGPHKTGTTYIQRRLALDRELLASESGVLYPWTGQDLLWGQHGLREVFSDPLTHGPEIDRLIGELRGWSTGLISSERLSRIDEKGFACMRDTFPDRQVTVMAYLRVRSELVVSYWAESVKHGAVISLPRFVRDQLVAPLESPVLNQKKLIDTVARVFGNESVRVFLYRRDVDLYEEFLRVVVGPTDLLSRSSGRWETVNPTLPLADTECLRLVSLAARERGLSSATEVASGFVAARHDPAFQSDLQAFRESFEANATPLDLSNLDEDFLALDRQLFSEYAANLQGAAASGRYPQSSVREIRCLQDSISSETRTTAAIASRVLDRLLAVAGPVPSSGSTGG